jgi:large subunit ribosomal protein L23
VREIFDVIAAPLVTEKGTMVSEEGNQVVLRVRPEANKEEIRRAVESIFKVKVTKIRTMNYLGKTRRVGRNVGRRASWKKAYVRLASGQRIDFFETV